MYAGSGFVNYVIDEARQFRADYGVSSIVIDGTRKLTRCVSVSSIAKRSLIPGLVVLGARDVSSRACASCKMQVVTSCGWSVGTTKEAMSAMRDWGHKVAPLSKGMVLTARFGTWLEIGARATGNCGGLNSGRELAWWRCRDRDQH